MSATYCAPCHGVDGKGHGPVPSARKARSIDLTVLSKKNNRKYPETHVINVLWCGSAFPAHAEVEMPSWGSILAKINKGDPRDKMLRINILSSYLETIQVQ